MVGGAVTYSNELKVKLLGVQTKTLQDHGAVSEATVREMVAGIRRVTGATVGVAASGVLGPEGGTPDKPVGTVWIAVSIYVLVAIAKKKFMLNRSLYEILQIISISIFERMPINQLFQQTQLQYFKEQNSNQLNLFDL